MGKHGPCYHCGVTSTPLWRNGPPDKPVLCNACGSRWRTKGTLANYTPLHAREEESKVSLDKYTSFKLKGHDTHKKKQNIVRIKAEFGRTNFDQNFQKGLDDDDLTSESSSGSAGSYSDSCAHFGDTSEATGSCQSNMWDTLVPSRRRSGATRSKPSPAEKLTKDLHSILHQQSSYLSASSDDLLYETGASMDAEIGHGVLLLKKSHSNTKAEESEASSFLIDNKSVQSGFPLSTHYKSKNPCVPGMEDKKYSNLKTPQGYPLREKPSQDKFHILLNKDSYLASINLKDIVNFDGYMRCLTSEERQHLVKYLPDTGTANLTESLRSMFSSTQFQEALPYFQHLLKEGIFDLSFPGLSTEECRKVRKAALTNLTKAKLIEQCNTLKEAIAKPFGKKGSNSNVSSLKRSQESLISSLSEPKVSMKCSKKLCKIKLEQLPMDFPSRRPHAGGKSIEGTAACKNEEFSCFSLTSLSAASSHKSCIMDNLGSADNNSDEELLLDVRSNTSFPEAELLSDHWSQRKFSESFCEGSGVSEKEGSLCCNSSVSFNSNRLKHG